MGFLAIGTVIKDRRKNLGITRHRLAALAGISVNTLYKLEQGLSNPTMDVLMKVAEILGMEVKLELKRKG